MIPSPPQPAARRSIPPTFLVLGVLLALAVGAPALATPAPAGCDPATATVEPKAQALEAYARTLQQHVNEEGLVDYKRLKSNRPDLHTFLSWVAAVDPTDFKTWDEKERLAFWINAYNAYTLELILDHYPIRSTGVDGPENSIRQIPGNWDKIRFPVLGKKMTLNEIEHETIRKRFNEPGVHVALVCAALGCPRLLDEPYTAARLDTQLEDQARRYFASDYGLKIDEARGKVFLSSIYDWFKGDFARTYGKGSDFSKFPAETAATLRYVTRYAPASARDFLRSGRFSVDYISYDWTLNEPSNP